MTLHNQPTKSTISVFTKISLKSICFMSWIHIFFSYFNFINLYLRSICLYLHSFHSFHLLVPSLNDSNLTMQLEDLD